MRFLRQLEIYVYIEHFRVNWYSFVRNSDQKSPVVFGDGSYNLVFILPSVTFCFDFFLTSSSLCD